MPTQDTTGKKSGNLISTSWWWHSEESTLKLQQLNLKINYLVWGFFGNLMIHVNKRYYIIYIQYYIQPAHIYVSDLFFSSANLIFLYNWNIRFKVFAICQVANTH